MRGARVNGRASSDLTGSFDGPERLIRQGAARSAMWHPRSQMAGKRRNTADEPLWPTEGQILLARGRVALLIRCPASHFEALLTTGQKNPVK